MTYSILKKTFHSRKRGKWPSYLPLFIIFMTPDCVRSYKKEFQKQLFEFFPSRTEISRRTKISRRNEISRGTSVKR